MRPDQPQGRQARGRPSVAEINRRAEEPPRPQHPLLDLDRQRVRHRHTQSLPHQQEYQQRGDHRVQDDPNTYQDGHRRYHSSVIGRIGPNAPENISTPFLENYQGIPTRVQYVEPQYSGTQYSGGSQYPGPRYPGLQFPGPQYPGPQYPGPQFPGPQHLAPQFPGLQYPGLQYSDLQSPVSRQFHGLDNTHRPIFDEYGIPQVIGDIPRFQEGFGQSSSAFNDQMFAGPPDLQAGIPNSMAPFDNTIQYGNMNASYMLPDPRFGNSFQEQEVARDPFQSLLSTPYLLPAPLPSSPTQQPAIAQDSYQPSSGTSHLAARHGQTRSRATKSQGSNLREIQTTIDPLELDIVEHNPQRPLTRPADQTSNLGERHRARNSRASAAHDQQPESLKPGPDQQLHTPTRHRAPNDQRGSRHNQGQDSGKRKRRAHSSPEAGSSPKASSPMTPIAGRRQGQNPKNGSRVYFDPQPEKQTPKEPDTSEQQDQTRRLIVRLPSKSGVPPKNANRRRAPSSPEAGSSPVITHDDQNDNANDEQQQADDAQNPSLPNQDSGSPSRPPQRLSAKKRRSRRNSFFADLAACNGVIIPSKLKPGEAPRIAKQSNRNAPKTSGSECPICGERFGQKHHLQQHFAACVNRNGNPDGHYWDDLVEYK